MASSSATTRHLVLVGGGHSHALLLRLWRERPVPGVRLTLINPGRLAHYSGMAPGHIAGHYRLDEITIDLGRLADSAGARLLEACATGIDREAKRIELGGGPAIAYDLLSLDIGIDTHMPDLPGFQDHATPAKPLGDFVAAWSNWCDALVRDAVAPRICVIGAGLAGVELAFAMRYRTGRLGRPAEIRLVESGRALASVGLRSRSSLLARMRRQEILLEEETEIAAVTAGGVVLRNGERRAASFVLGTAGARARSWISETGLETHEGFVTVDRHLQSLTDPAIFACGDCAHLGFAPRPKAGVYAVRAAPVLFQNLRAALGEGHPRAFRPQSDYLKLVSFGGRVALADRGCLAVSGGWVWRWKDRIDRGFMRRFPTPGDSR